MSLAKMRFGIFFVGGDHFCFGVWDGDCLVGLDCFVLFVSVVDLVWFDFKTSFSV